MTRIKICGVTQVDDAIGAVAAGADFIGLNFWPRSKRHITPDDAVAVAAAIRGAGTTQIAGVFVDASIDDIAMIVRKVDLDIVQLHGDESAETVAKVAVRTGKPVWKAAPARRDAQLDYPGADVILLDTPSVDRGGTGRTFDWTIAADAIRNHPNLQLMLAGGLSPENVAAAISAVRPWGVDVASGVESAPGVKDLGRIVAFAAAVRAAGMAQ